MIKDSYGRTPRAAIVDEVADALVRVRWDHPSLQFTVNSVFEQLRRRAHLVDAGLTILSITPFLPRTVGQRIERRTPFSFSVVRYLDRLTPTARDRLVREAWKKANPTWTVPSSSSKPSSTSTRTTSSSSS